jgi:hypothetical protein
MSGRIIDRKWVRVAIACASLLAILSCAAPQRLVSISVTPATVVFGAPDPTLHAQLTATGTYEHPPATKDITNQVTWTSSITQVAQVSSTGLLSPSTYCGVSPITASLLTNTPKGNVITGTMNVTVNGSASGCPSGAP